MPSWQPPTIQVANGFHHMGLHEYPGRQRGSVLLRGDTRVPEYPVSATTGDSVVPVDIRTIVSAHTTRHDAGDARCAFFTTVWTSFAVRIARSFVANVCFPGLSPILGFLVYFENKNPSKQIDHTTFTSHSPKGSTGSVLSTDIPHCHAYSGRTHNFWADMWLRGLLISWWPGTDVLKPPCISGEMETKRDAQLYEND